MNMKNQQTMSKHLGDFPASSSCDAIRGKIAKTNMYVLSTLLRRASTPNLCYLNISYINRQFI